MKRILESEPAGWYILRIDESTVAKNFKGENIHYDHYYRIFSGSDKPIPYCKFQKIDKLAQILGVDASVLPVV